MCMHAASYWPPDSLPLVLMHVVRHDLEDYVVLYEDCKYEANNELYNLIDSGFWPGNIQLLT